MTYVVLKEYLYDPIDCIRPAVAIERGKFTEKTVLFKETFNRRWAPSNRNPSLLGNLNFVLKISILKLRSKSRAEKGESSPFLVLL